MMGRDGQRTAIQLNVWVEGVQMQVAWQLAMLECQYHFDHPGNPSGCFQMANVSFD